MLFRQRSCENAHEVPMNRRTTVERAYDLARSGVHPDLYALERALKAEGRSDVRAQISGRQIRKDLMALCRTAYQSSAPETFQVEHVAR